MVLSRRAGKLARVHRPGCCPPTWTMPATVQAGAIAHGPNKGPQDLVTEPLNSTADKPSTHGDHACRQYHQLCRVHAEELCSLSVQW